MGSTIEQVPVFLYNVLLHWQALITGGVVTAAFAAYQGVTHKQVRIRTYVFTFVFAAFVASCFLAWHDEHQNTAAVIVDKAHLINGWEGCQSDLRASVATLHGKEELASSLQATVNGLQAPELKQQGIINNCVLSLGKMNPALRRKNSVVTIPIGAKDEASNKFAGLFTPHKVYLHMLLVTTNEMETRPLGNVRCENSFNIESPPQLFTMGPTMTSNIRPIPISDKEYEIRVFNTGSEWSPNSPIYFTISTVMQLPGVCEFQQP